MDIPIKDKAAALGVTASQIEERVPTTPTARAGYCRPSTARSMESARCAAGSAPEFQEDPNALSKLYFKGSGAAGPVVPLDTLATTRQQVGPQTVNHYGQLPAVSVSPRARAEVRRLGRCAEPRCVKQRWIPC